MENGDRVHVLFGASEATRGRWGGQGVALEVSPEDLTEFWQREKVRCKWNELQEQRHLDEKYRMCSGNRVHIGWNTQYMRENWRSRLRHRQFRARRMFGVSFTREWGAIRYLKGREYGRRLPLDPCDRHLRSSWGQLQVRPPLYMAPGGRLPRAIFWSQGGSLCWRFFLNPSSFVDKWVTQPTHHQGMGVISVWSIR